METFDVQEGDLVPEGYWETLEAALKNCPRLPEYDVATDPPVIV